jgi:ribosomal protein S13
MPLKVQNLRVNNVEIPNSKKVEISLQYIYGIGSTTAKAILRDTVRRETATAAAAGTFEQANRRQAWQELRYQVSGDCSSAQADYMPVL